MSSRPVINSMFDIFLGTSDYYWGDHNTVIKTVLGSCVAICIWHPKKRIGGMCHALMPAAPPELEKKDPKYVDHALDLIGQSVAAANTRPADYHVKIFGGATALNGIQSSLAVGGSNILAAIAGLEERGYKITAQHTGGHGSRNLIFNLATGEVWMKYLDRSHHHDNAQPVEKRPAD